MEALTSKRKSSHTQNHSDTVGGQPKILLNRASSGVTVHIRNS